MQKVLFIIPLILIILLISFLVVLTLFYNSINARRTKALIVKKLREMASENQTFSIEKAKNMPFDFILELKSEIYYIKLIRGDLKMNLYIESPENIYFMNSVKKNKKVMTRGIRPLVETALPIESNKEVKKMFIIFPKSTFIFHRLSEHQEEYVYPTKEIYGAYYVSGEDFLNF